MQVFLIRHPKPVIDAGICYGRLDVDAHAPHAVADEIRPLLPRDVPVYSSPLRRARQLAEALHPAPVFDARLAEIEQQIAQLTALHGTIADLRHDAAHPDPDTCSPDQVCRYL